MDNTDQKNKSYAQLLDNVRQKLHHGAIVPAAKDWQKHKEKEGKKICYTTAYQYMLKVKAGKTTNMNALVCLHNQIKRAEAQLS